jgi:hypothetical protein
VCGAEPTKLPKAGRNALNKTLLLIKAKKKLKGPIKAPNKAKVQSSGCVASYVNSLNEKPRCASLFRAFTRFFPASVLKTQHRSRQNPDAGHSIAVLHRQTNGGDPSPPQCSSDTCSNRRRGVAILGGDLPRQLRRHPGAVPAGHRRRLRQPVLPQHAGLRGGQRDAPPAHAVGHVPGCRRGLLGPAPGGARPVHVDVRPALHFRARRALQPGHQHPLLAVPAERAPLLRLRRGARDGGAAPRQLRPVPGPVRLGVRQRGVPVPQPAGVPRRAGGREHELLRVPPPRVGVAARDAAALRGVHQRVLARRRGQVPAVRPGARVRGEGGLRDPRHHALPAVPGQAQRRRRHLRVRPDHQGLRLHLRRRAQLHHGLCRCSVCAQLSQLERWYRLFIISRAAGS